MGMNMVEKNFYFSLPLPFCLILYSLPCGLWGLNANVLVFHLLFDLTGFIKSNQMCALLILPPQQRHREKDRNISHYLCNLIISPTTVEYSDALHENY